MREDVFVNTQRFKYLFISFKDFYGIPSLLFFRQIVYNCFLKRILDLAVAFLALPFVLLVAIPVAIAVKLEDGGPIFYRAPRYGKDMRKFTMFKFRSMKVDAPDIRNPDGTTFNSASDSRQTRVGKFLRKTSLDELPQFLNILLGDMSLIGPRPSPMGNEATYTDFIKKKFRVRPGITGLNQALVRNTGTIEQRYENDVFYAGHVSFLLDARIVFLTAKNVLLGKNIYHS